MSSAVSVSTEQLSRDIAELQQLRNQAQLPNVQKALDELLRQWEIQSKSAPISKNSNGPTSSNGIVGKAEVRPLKKLTTYAFDESDKFVKLYYTVPGLTGASSDVIKTDFCEKSFFVLCTNVKGMDYEIRVQGLCQEIDPSKSQVKQKSSDQLLVMLKKVHENQSWGSLLKLEKDKEKSKMPKMDDKADPQESLMTMMKQMYDDGDDDMKRTMRKAWHEAQSKKGAGMEPMDI